MSLRDAIADVCTDVINSLSVLRLRLLTSDGAKPLVIRHQSGAKLELKNDGKVYYNGSEILTGTGSGVTNPMTSDLDTGGYKIYNDSGAVTFESSTGVFTFQKSSWG